jgi:hypothetical protein
MIYAQCLLTKAIEKGCLKTIAWIPSEFAAKGRILKLKQEDGSWNNGWMVEEVYSMHDESFVLEHERDFTKQRKASDI